MKNSIHSIKLPLILLLASLLIACGGGGGGGGGDETGPATSNNASTAAGSSSADNSSTTPSESTTDNESTAPSGTTNQGSQTAAPSKELVSVTLTWTAPTSRQNGDPLLPSELAGYEIYYFQDGSPEENDQIIVINDASTTEVTIDNLSTGTYFFAIATIDSEGLTSDTSDYVEATIE